MTIDRRRFVSLAALPAAAGIARAVRAQPAPYPNHQIRLVSPYTPGGGNDTLARLLAAKLTPLMGQPIIVLNKPGAGTMIGNDFVAKAEPDGYTWVINGNGFVINPNFYKKMAYDTMKDIACVSFIGFSTEALVCNLDLPVHSVGELIALAKAKPGTLNFGTSGNGGPGHFAGVQFNQMAGTNIKFIPYKGTEPAIAALLAGQVQCMITPLSTVPRGKARILGVATKERSRQYPDIPTIAEAGVPGYEAFLWFGLMTTGGTPQAVIDKINGYVRKVLREPDVVKALTNMDMTPAGDQYAAPQQFAAFVRADLEKSARIARDAGIQPE
jgi:tripartite-type tricarboxylate transporter receptor subunit TctC